jgi:hypothetical protein
VSLGGERVGGDASDVREEPVDLELSALGALGPVIDDVGVA